jgi:hypothetical protein
MNDTNDVRLVGRKSKLPLLLILAALAAAALAYMMWKSQDSAMTAAPASETPSQEDQANDVRTIAGIYALTEVGGLHNRNFELQGAVVADVVSDRLFYVSEEGNGQQLLVHLDENLDEGGAEGRVQVETGQRLDLRGELKDASQAAIEGSDYTDDEASAAGSQRMYLHVTDLELK